MGKYKICVYAITKNEEQFVKRWADAVKEADAIIVTDTGSTDHTVEWLREEGVTVYEEKIIPWRFDTARNIAMNHIPEEYDICVSNDLDEVFEPGWREKLENSFRPEHTSARYTFTWSYNEDGTPNKQFSMEKIHRRHGYRWVHPVHEVLEYNGEIPEKTADCMDIVLNHYPDLTKPRTQYLPLLELSAEENPTDVQTIFWLGREYMFYHKLEECITTMRRYLALPNALWGEERCAAMRYIAVCYGEKGEYREAKRWLYRAMGECPTIREPYMDMASIAYKEGDWTALYYMAEMALRIKGQSGSYLMEEACWGAQPYDYSAIACYWLGLYQKAIVYAQTAYHLNPQDPRLKANLEIIKKSVEVKENGEI